MDGLSRYALRSGRGSEICSWFITLVLPHAFTFEFNTVCAMDKPVENGVSHGGIADQFVPAGGRKLAGDQRGTCTVVSSRP